MRLDFVPLLRVQRELYDLPRGKTRFDRYHALLDYEAPQGRRLAPFLIVNPMAREPVAATLDALLALDADGVAAQAAAEAEADLSGVPGGPCRVSLVVADDAGGGWTNRYAWEFSRRFERPTAATAGSLTGVAWASEPPTAQVVREAVLTAVWREAYFQRHGLARTLRERLAQEGAVLRAAGGTAPALEFDEIEYTREVIREHLDTTDLPTAIVHLFGDPAARSLGYAPSGLAPWAGLALALHDAYRAAPDASPAVTRVPPVCISPLP